MEAKTIELTKQKSAAVAEYLSKLKQAPFLRGLTNAAIAAIAPVSTAAIHFDQSPIIAIASVCYRVAGMFILSLDFECLDRNSEPRLMGLRDYGQLYAYNGYAHTGVQSPQGPPVYKSPRPSSAVLGNICAYCPEPKSRLKTTCLTSASVA
jgi:hypothetical protein